MDRVLDVFDEGYGLPEIPVGVRNLLEKMMVNSQVGQAEIDIRLRNISTFPDEFFTSGQLHARWQAIYFIIDISGSVWTYTPAGYNQWNLYYKQLGVPNIEELKQGILDGQHRASLNILNRIPNQYVINLFGY